MKLRNGLVGMVVASALAVGGGAVGARTVSVSADGVDLGPFDVGGSWFVNFSGIKTDASALATWTYKDFDDVLDANDNIVGVRWYFDINVSNDKYRLSSFGWNSDPAVSTQSNAPVAGVTNLTSWFIAAGAVPDGGGTFDVCLKGGGGSQNCAGGGSGGIGEGDDLDFKVYFQTAAVTDLQFTSFFARWQDITGQDATSDSGPGTPMPIPLPGAGFLLLGAAGGLGWLKLRERKAAA